MKKQMAFQSARFSSVADAARILPLFDAAVILAVSICLALLRIIL